MKNGYVTYRKHIKTERQLEIAVDETLEKSSNLLPKSDTEVLHPNGFSCLSSTQLPTYACIIHLFELCLYYQYIFKTVVSGFFTPAKTLPNSKSCPHLRLHTYFEKPEQLTDCLCLRRITAKILSDHCHSTCCAHQH